MKKLIILLCVLLIACEKEDVQQVTLSINIDEFKIDSDRFKKASSVFDDFNHKYAPGVLTFTEGNGKVYTFDTNDKSLNGYSITIPVGQYTITGDAGEPVYYSMDVMSFYIENQFVSIPIDMESLNVSVTPTCSLILVADPEGLLTTIQFRKDKDTWALFSEGIYWYGYFEPSDGVFIDFKKKNGYEFSLDSKRRLNGYVYKVEVIDNDVQAGLSLEDPFIDGDIIVW